MGSRLHQLAGFLKREIHLPIPQLFSVTSRVSWLIQMHLLVLLVMSAIIAILLGGQAHYYPLYAVMLVTALAGFFNLVCFSLLRRHALPESAVILAILGFDVIIITIFVHFTGGLISLFNLAYFLIIVAGSIFISYRAGVALALGSFLAFAVIVLLEFYGVVARYPLFDVSRRLPHDHIYVYLTVYLSGLLFYTIALLAGQVGKILTRTQATMSYVEKMTALGRLAAGVAHEVNNPLGNIITWLDSAEAAGRELTRADTALIRRELTRAAELLHRLLAYPRAPERQSVPTRLDAVITEAAILLRGQCERAKVKLRLDLAPDLPAVTLVPAELKEIIVNLAFNALDAMADGAGTLGIATRAEPERGRVVVRVSDTGVGIAPADRHRIFEPFYTTKPAGQGTGLGLFIVDALVSGMGGTLEVESEPGQGAAFTITLPAGGRPESVPA